MHFNDDGGNMGTTGSVAFLFQRMGVFRLEPEGIDLEALELELIDHGLEELGEGKSDKGEQQLVVRCAFTDFGTLQTAIEARKHHADLGRVRVRRRRHLVELPEDKANEVLKLVDALEQDDDVQHVFHNLA